MRRLFAILFALLALNYVQAQTSGTCGDNLTWSFDEGTGTLTIYGTGAMYDYASAGAPWYGSRASIKEVKFTGAPTRIGNYAFQDCTVLATIELPTSVTSIGTFAFFNCFAVTTLDIPSSVTSIEDEAFSGCTHLKGIVIPAGVTSIGYRTFCNCYALESIVIPSSVTSIGDEAFRGCTHLKAVEAPEGLTSIGNRIFYDCYDLKSVVIPSSVTSIGEQVFEYCRSLTSIVSFIAAEKLFVPGSNAFSGVNKSTCTLYVPAGAKSTYAATEQWKDFTNVVEAIFDGQPYTATAAVECPEVTYIRTFGNTNWQAWYVPFAIDYEQLSDDFEVAEINDIHQYDTDRDGAMDKTELEVVKMVAGTLRANYPYLVRAKEAGEKSITVSGATLEAANNTVIDCSSVKLKYYFAGTCAGVSGQEMFDGGYYALSSGTLMQAADNSVALKPLRWYMRIESRGEAVSAGVIRIRVLGDDTTGVREVETVPRGEAVYYDLSGRRVENPTRGIYIVNGKKVYIK